MQGLDRIPADQPFTLTGRSDGSKMLFTLNLPAQVIAALTRM